MSVVLHGNRNHAVQGVATRIAADAVAQALPRVIQFGVDNWPDFDYSNPGAPSRIAMKILEKDRRSGKQITPPPQENNNYMPSPQSLKKRKRSGSSSQGRYVKRRVSRVRAMNYRRKSQRRRYKLKKKFGRSRRGTAKSLGGGRALMGSLSEEDKNVKKHMRYGVVYEYGTSATLTSPQGVGLCHATFPERSVLVCMFMALFKKLLNLHEGVIKDWEDVPFYPGAYNANKVYVTLTYEYQVTSTTVSDANIQIATEPLTYLTWFSVITQKSDVAPGLVEKFIDEFYQGRNNQRWFRVTKFKTFSFVYENATAGLGQAGAIGLDLDNVTFNLDLVSNLVYQNRSVADDGSGSALDIDQQPLFEVQLGGRGTQILDVTQAINLVPPVDITTGVSSILFGSDKNLLAEPAKGKYSNVRTVANVICSPGVIKSHKLKSHYKLKFNTLIKKLVGFTATFSVPPANALPTVAVRDTLGEFCYHWFRKTISLSGGQNLLMAYQHHWAAGCTVSYKKDSRTGPYIGRLAFENAI